MAARFNAMNTQPCFCNAYAAEGTSVRAIDILGTAVLAVSIIRLLDLLVLIV